MRQKSLSPGTSILVLHLHRESFDGLCDATNDVQLDSRKHDVTVEAFLGAVEIEIAVSRVDDEVERSQFRYRSVVRPGHKEGDFPAHWNVARVINCAHGLLVFAE